MTTAERLEPGLQSIGPGSAPERALGWARANRLLLGAIVAGTVLRLLYWAIADRRLDDALITIKHAKNLAEGNGLVHHLGEVDPVHGFTSALSVLIPIPGELIADGGGLFVLRAASLVAFVLGAVYAYRISKRLGLGTWPTLLVLAYLAFDQNQVFYGMAGMETQVAVAILLAGVWYVLDEDYPKAGAALGLALLARPDFVLWVGPAYLFLLWRNPSRALKAGLVTTAIVLPWLLFTTAYYGSPVPNTIEAKSAAFAVDFPSLGAPGAWLDFSWNQLKAHQGDWQTIAPFLERSFVFHTPVPYFLLKLIAWVIAGLALVGAVSTWRLAAFRAAIAYVIAFALYKIFFLTIGYFEWYGPPAIAVIFILAGAGLQRLTRARPWLAATPAIVLALAYAMHVPFTLPLERTVQHDIEDKVRDPLGRYLGDVAKPGETIVTEPSGYFGYYTNATLLDFPGLTSKRVVDALEEHPELSSLPGMTKLLGPDWLVLRPAELQSLQEADPDLAARYEETIRFSVPEDQSSLDRWGLTIGNVDRDFIVLRRN